MEVLRHREGAGGTSLVQGRVNVREKKQQAVQTLHLNMTDTNAAQEPFGNGSNRGR